MHHSLDDTVYNHFAPHVHLPGSGRPQQYPIAPPLSNSTHPPPRFWATPAVSNSSRTNAIPPLLGQVFPEGLAPLSDKIDELVERSERHLRDEIQEQRLRHRAAMAAAAVVSGSPPSSPELGGRGGRQSTPAGLRMQRIQVSDREGEVY